MRADLSTCGYNGFRPWDLGITVISTQISGTAGRTRLDLARQAGSLFLRFPVPRREMESSHSSYAYRPSTPSVRQTPR